MAGIVRLLGWIAPNRFRAMGGPSGMVTAAPRTGRPERKRRTGDGRFMWSASGREEPALAAGDISGPAMVSRGRDRPRSYAPAAGDGSVREQGRGIPASRFCPQRPTGGPANPYVSPMERTPQPCPAVILTAPSSWQCRQVRAAGSGADGRAGGIVRSPTRPALSPRADGLNRYHRAHCAGDAMSKRPTGTA